MADRVFRIAGDPPTDFLARDNGDGTFALGSAMLRTAPEIRSLVIAGEQTESDAYDARGSAIFGLVMPAQFTGTVLTFQVSVDEVDWFDLYDTANLPVTLDVVAGRAYDLPTEVAAFPYWRLVSDAAEGSERVFLIVAKG